jgi:tetratricopeptide (TPR) repeat protein
MNRIILLIASFLLLSFSVLAQNAKKGYKWLEKLEYEKAKEVFNELFATDNKNPAVNLGLALIYSDDQSPFYDLVQGWSHCILLQQNMDKLAQEDLEYIGEYFMNTEKRPSSRPVKKKIEYAVSIIESHLIKHVREENNLALTYEVIEKFPDFRYYGNVVHIRNQLEFRKYEKQNSLEGYIEFIERFPEAAQMDKAIAYRNKLAFERACSLNTVEAYEDYMFEYPDAPEYTRALKNRNALAFSRAKTTHTLRGYEVFISRYPEAFEVAEAKVMQKQLLFEYAKTIKTLEAYDEFIKKYPEGQQYIDIFNLKSLYLGNLYLASSNFTSGILWARSFDLANENETCGSLCQLENGHYFLAVTSRKSDTSFADAWLICIDSVGRMIWNKTAGSDYNDQVIYSSVNRKNEVVMAGYSWTGEDTSAREVWLFKQAPDGRNIWSQRLGKWVLHSLVTDSNDRILLGGYQCDDSLRRHYRIMELNDMGRKLWERTYSDYGEVNFLGILPDQSVLVVAGNWISRMDNRGYIVWEYVPPPENVYWKGLVSENGETYIGGVRNNKGLLITKFSVDGKKKWDKQYVMPDSAASIVKMTELGSGKVLLALTYKNTGNGFLWINSLTGEILKEKHIAGDRIMDFRIDNEKNFWIVLENKNAVLIKMNGYDF